MLGFIIGIIIASLFWLFVLGGMQSRYIHIYHGKPYMHVAGKRYCPHQLAIHHQVNGFDVRGCALCDGVFVGIPTGHDDQTNAHVAESFYNDKKN